MKIFGNLFFVYMTRLFCCLILAMVLCIGNAESASTVTLTASCSGWEEIECSDDYNNSGYTSAITGNAAGLTADRMVFSGTYCDGAGGDSSTQKCYLKDNSVFVAMDCGCNSDLHKTDSDGKCVAATNPGSATIGGCIVQFKKYELINPPAEPEVCSSDSDCKLEGCYRGQCNSGVCECAGCDAGYYRNEQDKMCQKCTGADGSVPGYIVSSVQNNTGGLEACSIKCAPGYYGDAKWSNGPSGCTKCPLGSGAVLDDTQSDGTECVYKCADGFVGNPTEKDPTCESCPDNSSPLNGVCVCNDGYKGSPRKGQGCLLCDTDEICEDGGIKCPDGHYLLGSSVTGACAKCPANYETCKENEVTCKTGYYAVWQVNGNMDYFIVECRACPGEYFRVREDKNVKMMLGGVTSVSAVTDLEDSSPIQVDPYKDGIESCYVKADSNFWYGDDTGYFVWADVVKNPDNNSTDGTTGAAGTEGEATGTEGEATGTEGGAAGTEGGATGTNGCYYKVL